jgi:hypothetical protein
MVKIFYIQILWFIMSDWFYQKLECENEVGSSHNESGFVKENINGKHVCNNLTISPMSVKQFLFHTINMMFKSYTDFQFLQ